MFTRHTPLITSKWTEDGYDAASETGKGDDCLTDGMEEDNAIEEEMEDRDDFQQPTSKGLVGFYNSGAGSLVNPFTVLK